MVAPEFDEAITEIEYAKLSEPEKRYYRARMDYLRDQHAIMTENVEYASRDARAKALIEGREEGRVQGEADAKRAFILKTVRKKFGLAHGQLDSRALQKLEAKILTLDPSELDAMLDRVLDAQTVDEVF